MLDLWEKILKRVVKLTILEDNQATIKIIAKGYSAKLRHVQRTQKVNIGSIHDVISKPPLQVTGWMGASGN